MATNHNYSCYTKHTVGATERPQVLQLAHVEQASKFTDLSTVTISLWYSQYWLIIFKIFIFYLLITGKVWFILYHAMYPIACMWVYIAYTVHVSVHCLYCACECTLPILCMWVYIAYTVHVSVHCLYCACECALPILCMWVYIAYTVHVSAHCLYCACECTLPILCMWVYIAYTVHVSVHCLAACSLYFSIPVWNWWKECQNWVRRHAYVYHGCGL